MVKLGVEKVKRPTIWNGGSTLLPVTANQPSELGDIYPEKQHRNGKQLKLEVTSNS